MALFLFVAILLSATDKLWALEICCPGLGCYDNAPPYDYFLLPLPLCPEGMNIVMKLYTRQNPTDFESITRDTIPSAFKTQTKTIFIVHGWFDNDIMPWKKDMKDAFLAQGDYNVIIVDWKGGSQSPYYPQPAANTRTVGGEIALVVDNIISNGHATKALMYCVGHSLGAQVCGHAGQKGQFGRITGLDPAGPLFTLPSFLSIGLNSSSADLVDIIHTDGVLGAGTLRRLGHIDFYPNGGTKQPGCIVSGSLSFEGVFLTTLNTWSTLLNLVLSCNHIRSILYFNESIQSPCFLSRYSCENQNQLPDSCTASSDVVQSMGFNATAYPGRGIFYLTTNSAPPFCQR